MVGCTWPLWASKTLQGSESGGGIRIHEFQYPWILVSSGVPGMEQSQILKAHCI